MAQSDFTECTATNELDTIVDELKALQRSGLDRSFAVGKLIFERFFRASIPAWRDRRRGKEHSLRSLAERPGCPFSKSALHQAVSVYVASRALPVVQTFRHVDASHIQAVLCLSSDEQVRLLRLTNEHRWSVRRLRREVALHSRRSERASAPSSIAIQDHVAGRVRRCADAMLGAAQCLHELSLAGPRSAELESSVAGLLHAQAVLARAVTQACEGRRHSDICPSMEAASEPASAPGTREARIQAR
jgi:hypothetical protein